MGVIWLIRFLIALYLSLYVIVMINMNKTVPQPYMDEIFHYPMTERYFEGKSCVSTGLWNRQLHILGSQDHHLPRTLYCRKHVGRCIEYK